MEGAPLYPRRDALLTPAPSEEQLDAAAFAVALRLSRWGVVALCKLPLLASICAARSGSLTDAQVEVLARVGPWLLALRRRRGHPEEATRAKQAPGPRMQGARWSAGAAFVPGAEYGWLQAGREAREALYADVPEEAEASIAELRGQVVEPAREVLVLSHPEPTAARVPRPTPKAIRPKRLRSRAPRESRQLELPLRYAPPAQVRVSPPRRSRMIDRARGPPA